MRLAAATIVQVPLWEVGDRHMGPSVLLLASLSYLCGGDLAHRLSCTAVAATQIPLGENQGMQAPVNCHYCHSDTSVGGEVKAWVKAAPGVPPQSLSHL